MYYGQEKFAMKKRFFRQATALIDNTRAFNYSVVRMFWIMTLNGRNRLKSLLLVKNRTGLWWQPSSIQFYHRQRRNLLALCIVCWFIPLFLAFRQTTISYGEYLAEYLRKSPLHSLRLGSKDRLTIYNDEPSLFLIQFIFSICSIMLDRRRQFVFKSFMNISTDSIEKICYQTKNWSSEPTSNFTTNPAIPPLWAIRKSNQSSSSPHRNLGY